MSTSDGRKWWKDPYLYLLSVGLFSLLVVELTSDFLAQLSRAIVILSAVVAFAIGLSVGAGVGKWTHRSWAAWVSFLLSAGSSGGALWYFLNRQIERYAEQAEIWMFHVPIVTPAICTAILFRGTRRR